MKKKRVKIRKLWNINPKTRIKESKKLYKRGRKKKELEDLLKEFL